MIVTKLIILLCATLTSGSDYYDLLGITKDADNKEIRKAFKKLAVTLHPDKNQDDPEAHDKFVKITRAYEVLKDPQQRKQYDLHGEEAPGKGWGGGQYHSYTYYRDHFGIYDDDPQVVTLNAADFDALVSKSGKQWFVNYYSPLCSHCHDLAPVWRSLASELEGVVMFGAVNCEDDWNLCRQQNIRSYPSLMFYPANERYSGAREKEALRRYILEHADTDVRLVTSPDEWAKLTEGSSYVSWTLLLCHSDDLPECLYDDERIQLAATLNGLVGVAVIDCVSVPICQQLTQGEFTSTVYWQRSSDGESFATRTVLADLPRDMAKEVFTYLPELLQLDSETFLDMVTQLELGSQTAWLVQFYLGTDVELDLEIRKLPAMLPALKVGRLHCAQYSILCQDYSISRYPSFAVFKPGGGYEFHHGAVSALSVAQFALESATATNLRTLSQQLYNQLVAQGDGHSAWFVDFYAPWCPPCLRLLPELRKASQSLDPMVRFGTVDCTIHAALCRQHNVQSYPTTVLFNQSQPSQLFRGEHSATSIVDFIQDIINPRVLKLTEETFYTTVGRKSPDSVWVVDFFMPWCGPCQQLAPQWRKLAKMVQDVPKVFIGEVNCEEESELCRQQGVRSYPSIRLYPLQSNGLNTVAMYNGHQRDAKSIRQWLFNFLPSAVEDLTSAGFQQVLEGKDYWLVDFYAPWCGHCHAFAPEFSTVAKKLEGRVRCAKVNCESEYAACQRAGVRAYPTVMFYQPNSRNARGAEVTTQQAEKIIQFVEERLRPQKEVHDEL